jgi:hypothetical protein
MQLWPSGVHTGPSLSPQIWSTTETEAPVHAMLPQRPSTVAPGASSPPHRHSARVGVAPSRTMARLEASRSQARGERTTHSAEVWPTRLARVCPCAGAPSRARHAAAGCPRPSPAPPAPRPRGLPPAVAAPRSWRRPAPGASQHRHTGSRRPGGEPRVRPARVGLAGRPGGALGAAGAAEGCARHAPHPGPAPQRAGIHGHHRLPLGGARRLPWPLGRPPPGGAPGLQLVVRQHPRPGLGRDRLHAPRADQLPGPCHTLPWRQGPPDHVRAVAGPLDHLPRPGGGKQPAAGRGVLCRPTPRAHGRQRAAPMYGHGVHGTPPVWQGPQTGLPRLIARWRAPVWPAPPGVSVAGATRPKWGGYGHRSQYVALICLPAWRPPQCVWCRSDDKSASMVQLFTPFSMGTCT